MVKAYLDAGAIYVLAASIGLEDEIDEVDAEIGSVLIVLAGTRLKPVLAAILKSNMSLQLFKRCTFCPESCHIPPSLHNLAALSALPTVCNLIILSVSPRAGGPPDAAAGQHARGATRVAQPMHRKL